MLTSSTVRFRLFLAIPLVLALAACEVGETVEDMTEADGSAEITPVVDARPAPDRDAPLLTVYKTPTCGCCAAWADHMERKGFRVETVDMPTLTALKDSLGVPSDLTSCHTGTVDGYVVEGHVPAEQVRRMLEERPDARGLAVPGMPIGSPGMEQGDTRQPYDVLIVDEGGEASVYEHIEGNTRP